MSPRTDEGRRRRWPVRQGAQRSGARPSGGEEGGIWPGTGTGSWLLQWRLGDRVLPAATTGEQARSQDPPCTSRGSRQKHVQEAVVLGGCPVPRRSFPLLDDALEDPTVHAMARAACLVAADRNSVSPKHRSAPVDSAATPSAASCGLGKSNGPSLRAQFVPNTPRTCGHSRLTAVSLFLCMQGKRLARASSVFVFQAGHASSILVTRSKRRP